MRDFFWSPYGCNDRPNLDMRNVFAGSHTEHRWRCSKSEGGNGSHHLNSSKKHMLIHPTRTFPSSRPLTKGLWECNGGRRAAWLRVSVKCAHGVVWQSMAVPAATQNLLLPFAPFFCTISRRSSSSAIARLLHLPNSGANSSRWRRTRGSRWRWSSRTVRSLVVAAPAVGMVQAGGDMVVELVVGVAGGLILLSAIAVGLSIACHPLWLVRWVQKFQPRVLYLAPTNEKVIALTLDDGPHAHITPQLLETLKDNESRATWFIIGKHMDPCPYLVERIYAEGHEVGNHTMYDVASWRLSKEEFEEQLMSTESRIKKYFHHDANGNLIKWFRPGHGFYNESILKTCEAHGYRVALGSIFPLDHMFQKQAKLLVQNVLWRVHPGAVIILHDRVPQWEQTPEVLRMLLPKLRKRGYKIVTLSELLHLQGTGNSGFNIKF
ncbi:unnamed protein product [Sphagnum jensenii]|uniref:NodB homology domain-containing protein n=1 Tax=Sphagnum jensenii TaxID=128206 RepID=A0ABP1A752_9BRYO